MKRAVLYSTIKYGCYFYLPLAHSGFNSYAPELVPIFYYRDNVHFIVL